MTKSISVEMSEVNVGHPVVNALLNQQYRVAKEKNIGMTFAVSDLHDIRISDDDIVVLLGNLIENCIHTFAGVQLRWECHNKMIQLRKKYGKYYEQPTAVPMLTEAYNLPAKKVIHIVGPIVQENLNPALKTDLASCYWNTLEMCRENGLKSVAFCCISTGVFHFPNKRAAEIAVATINKWFFENNYRMERVIFNVFKDEDRRYYEEILDAS